MATRREKNKAKYLKERPDKPLSAALNKAFEDCESYFDRLKRLEDERRAK